MSCLRCGRTDFEPQLLFIVNHGGGDAELSRAINAALHAQGIDGEERLGQLCEDCFQVAQACIQEGRGFTPLRIETSCSPLRGGAWPATHGRRARRD